MTRRCQVSGERVAPRSVKSQAHGAGDAKRAEKRIVREHAKAARKKFYEATRQIDALIVKTEDAAALAKALSPYITAAELLPEAASFPYQEPK